MLQLRGLWGVRVGALRLLGVQGLRVSIGSRKERFGCLGFEFGLPSYVLGRAGEGLGYRIRDLA